jgi:hypothetical protein
MLRSQAEITRQDVRLRRAIVVVIGAVLAALVVSVGSANAAVDPLVVLPNTVLSGLAGAHRTGTVAAVRQMSIAVDLKLRDPAGLTATAPPTPTS